MGAASTLHRVPRLEKEGTQEPPRPASPLLTPTPPPSGIGVHFSRTYRTWTEAENRDHSSSERASTWTEASSRWAPLRPTLSSYQRDGRPVKVPCLGGEEEEEEGEAGEGGGISFLTHIYSDVLHSVPCDVEFDVK